MIRQYTWLSEVICKNINDLYDCGEFTDCLLYTSDAADDRSRGLGDVYKRQQKNSE